MQNTESLQGLASARMWEERDEKESVMTLCLPGADWERGEVLGRWAWWWLMGVMSDLEEENKVVVGEFFFGCKLQRLNSN